MPDSERVIITRSLRKTISMRLLPDGRIEVKAPKIMPMLLINRFITQNEEWITRQREKILNRSTTTTRTYLHGEAFLYLGKHYSLDIGKYAEITLSGTSLRFPVGLQFRIKKELTDWYIRQAKQVLAERLEKNAAEMKVTYTDMYVSDTSSKWGSCSPDNRLQFNWRLIMAPMLVLNYVIVHELSHTVHKNHSRSFWNKVRSQNPSYRQQITWLKENGHTLIV